MSSGKVFLGVLAGVVFLQLVETPHHDGLRDDEHDSNRGSKDDASHYYRFLTQCHRAVS